MSTAVLLMAHGTPSTLDQMPAYLTQVRGGRPPSDALVSEMRRNYGAIGGQSPLTAITLQQRDALADRLGPSVPVLAGMRHWHPFIADVLAPLAGSGVDHVLGIPLAPQFSSLSVQKYLEAAAQALPPGVRLDCVGSYHDHPLLLQAFAGQVCRARERSEPDCVIFTAHSLPSRVIAGGDPYKDQVLETARGVAAAVRLDRYDVAFQSAGRTPEPWIGPDVGEVVRERAAGGARRVLVAPIGFVCDHTEILFDIDVQAREVARACGVTLSRTESLNASPSFIDLLVALVRGKLAREAGPGGAGAAD
jgi:ferrochelatase